MPNAYAGKLSSKWPGSRASATTLRDSPGKTPLRNFVPENAAALLMIARPSPKLNHVSMTLQTSNSSFAKGHCSTHLVKEMSTRWNLSHSVAW